MKSQKLYYTGAIVLALMLSAQTFSHNLTDPSISDHIKNHSFSTVIEAYDEGFFVHFEPHHLTELRATMEDAETDLAYERALDLERLLLAIFGEPEGVVVERVPEFEYREEDFPLLPSMVPVEPRTPDNIWGGGTGAVAGAMAPAAGTGGSL